MSWIITLIIAGFMVFSFVTIMALMRAASDDDATRRHNEKLTRKEDDNGVI